MFDIEKLKKIKIELDKSKEIVYAELSKIQELYIELSDFVEIVEPAIESLDYAVEHLDTVICELEVL